MLLQRSNSAAHAYLHTAMQKTKRCDIALIFHTRSPLLLLPMSVAVCSASFCTTPNFRPVAVLAAFNIHLSGCCKIFIHNHSFIIRFMIWRANSEGEGWLSLSLFLSAYRWDKFSYIIILFPLLLLLTVWLVYITSLIHTHTLSIN